MDDENPFEEQNELAHIHFEEDRIKDLCDYEEIEYDD
jgi:hypothetical protein